MMVIQSGQETKFRFPSGSEILVLSLLRSPIETTQPPKQWATWALARVRDFNHSPPSSSVRVQELVELHVYKTPRVSNSQSLRVSVVTSSQGNCCRLGHP